MHNKYQNALPIMGINFVKFNKWNACNNKSQSSRVLCHEGVQWSWKSSPQLQAPAALSSEKEPLVF